MIEFSIRHGALSAHAPGKIALIDDDAHRRAEISRFFLGMQYHVEPFEDVPELEGHWPSDGHILVHDSGERIAYLASSLSNTGTWLPIIAYSDTLQADRIVGAILEGAIDYWTLPLEDAAAKAGLERASQRADSFGSARRREAAARSRVKCLTGRELQVLAGMASGLQNREMAEQFGISPRTVEIHRSHMMSKLNVKSTTDAIRIAFATSLCLEPSELAHSA